jgi:ubiquinone/menaquinone biosynthesis C-methylase UbiE
MGFEQVRRDWTRLGADDPLWAVLIRPGTRHGHWDPDEFLATGRQEVEQAVAHLADLGVLRDLHDVLDFGCGAGRATQALAARAPRVVGVDVSPTMLEAARRLDRTDGRCTFLLNEQPDLSAFAEGSFDLVYSSLVLQHLPPELARAYLGEMMRVLRPHGAMAVQVATRPTRSVKGLLFRYAPQPLLRFGQRRILGYPAPMRMHAMSASEFADAVAPYGGRLVDSVEDDTYGGHWIYHRHFAVRR